MGKPVRILLISDLRSDPSPRLEEDLSGAIEAVKPDLILFAGDAVNSPDGLAVFKTCTARIVVLAPTFAVRGNWDDRRWGDLDLFGGTGVRELTGQAAEIAGIRLEGAGFGGGAVEEGKAFRVFLYHTPDEFERVKGRADLYCAGHTHGGQVAL